MPTVALGVESHEQVMRRARGRTWFLAGVFGLILGGMGVRAASLCVAPHDRTVSLGSQQRWEQMTLRARRGDIFDREGNRLVTSVDTPNVNVDPSWVDPDEVGSLSRKVARILDIDPDEVAARMRRKGSRYQNLARQVHPRLAAEIQDLGHKALWAESDQRRFYAEADLASQVLGYVDAQGEGHDGIEGSMDEWLRGSSVLMQRRRDRHGLDVDRLREVDRGTSAGMDVHLTLDRQIQRITERALAGVVERHAPKGAQAIVVDVRTGDLLAMAGAPHFNPNAVPEDYTPIKNRSVMDTLEPGSTFKPFVVAAAVEEGIVTTRSPIDCENGRWKVGRVGIGDDHPHGVVTVSEVVKYSSNIGSAKLAFKLGTETYLDYLARFGFGQRTGIDLPGEARGFVRPAETIKPIEFATTAFGQGVTATPVQIVYAIAAIANGGVRMKPRLVTSIVDEDGIPVRVTRPEVVGRVVSEETARAVAEAMVTVTEDGGTATRAQVPGFRVAGKTGTAQKPSPRGGYGRERIGSFVGFVPAEDPVLAIAVIVDEPTKGSRYGGLNAAPAFAEIAEQSLRHLGIQPDPALLDPPEDTSDDAVAEEEPRDPLGYDEGDWVLPDLTGVTVREALVALQGTGLSLEVEGTGRLAAMEPPAGARLSAGAPVRLTFRPY